MFGLSGESITCDSKGGTSIEVDILVRSHRCDCQRNTDLSYAVVYLGYSLCVSDINVPFSSSRNEGHGAPNLSCCLLIDRACSSRDSDLNIIRNRKVFSFYLNNVSIQFLRSDFRLSRSVSVITVQLGADCFNSIDGNQHLRASGSCGEELKGDGLVELVNTVVPSSLLNEDW